MNAYNGGVMQVNHWDDPVVVDLAGLAPPSRNVPVLLEHDSRAIVGHTEKVRVNQTSVVVDGVISGNTDEAEQVRVMGARKFPWQSSMGLAVREIEHLPAGEKARVNNRTVVGPVDIARKSTFREVSVVVWGADSTTSTAVTASQRDRSMFEELLEAMGIDASELTDEQRAKALALIEAQQQDEDDSEPDSKPKHSPKLKASAEDDGDHKELSLAERVREDIRAAAVSEQKRISAINATFKDFPELSAKAIEESWDEGRQKAELRAAQAERIASQRAGVGIDTFNIAVQDSQLFDDSRVIEAALCMTAGVSEEVLTDPLKHVNAAADRRRYQDEIVGFTEKQLDFAHKHFSGMGPQKAALWCARRKGEFSGIWGTDVVKSLRAAFSTVQLPTVFQNVITRILLGFVPDQPPVWNRIAKAGTARDFRTVTKFRVYGTGHWDKISGDSTLKHGTIDESAKYNNRLSTRGQYLELTREDFINDDVQALTDIGAMMGRYGLLAPEVGTFETLLENAGSFFSAGNGNYIDGAASVLGDAGLKSLYQTFLKRPDGKTSKDTKQKKPAAYLSVEPRVLLTPSELFLTGWEMTNASALSTAPASSRVSPSNFFANRFDVVHTPYLSDTLVHANASATAYYLFASPQSVETLSVLFLNGNQRPTIEMDKPRSDVLGMAIKGYIDFGVALVDPRGAAMSKGAA